MTNKPLPEPTLTFLWHSLEQFHGECTRHPSVFKCLDIITLLICIHRPGANELMCLFSRQPGWVRSPTVWPCYWPLCPAWSSTTTAVTCQPCWAPPSVHFHCWWRHGPPILASCSSRSPSPTASAQRWRTRRRWPSQGTTLSDTSLSPLASWWPEVVPELWSSRPWHR